MYGSFGKKVAKRQDKIQSKKLISNKIQSSIFLQQQSDHYNDEKIMKLPFTLSPSEQKHNLKYSNPEKSIRIVERELQEQKIRMKEKQKYRKKSENIAITEIDSKEFDQCSKNGSQNPISSMKLTVDYNKYNNYDKQKTKTNKYPFQITSNSFTDRQAIPNTVFMSNTITALKSNKKPISDTDRNSSNFVDRYSFQNDGKLRKMQKQLQLLQANLIGVKKKDKKLSNYSFNENLIRKQQYDKDKQLQHQNKLVKLKRKLPNQCQPLQQIQNLLNQNDNRTNIVHKQVNKNIIYKQERFAKMNAVIRNSNYFKNRTLNNNENCYSTLDWNMKCTSKIDENTKIKQYLNLVLAAYQDLYDQFIIKSANRSKIAKPTVKSLKQCKQIQMDKFLYKTYQQTDINIKKKKANLN